MTPRALAFLSGFEFIRFCILMDGYGVALLVGLVLGYLWWSDKPCKPRRSARMGPLS